MDEKKLKALAAELAKGLKTEADLNAFSRMLTVETALNAELTEHLGHEKNAPKTGLNTRNGYSSKTLLTDDGEVERSTPPPATVKTPLGLNSSRKIRHVLPKWIARFYPCMPKG